MSIYLDPPLQLLTLCLCSILLFVFTGARYSFLHYAKKSQASREIILAFIRQLKFPVDIRFDGEKPLIPNLPYKGKYKTLFDEILGRTTGEIRFSRNLAFILYLSFNLLMVIALFRQKTLIDTLIMLIYLIAQGLTMRAMWRFGHSLVDKEKRTTNN